MSYWGGLVLQSIPGAEGNKILYLVSTRLLLDRMGAGRSSQTSLFARYHRLALALLQPAVTLTPKIQKLGTPRA